MSDPPRQAFSRRGALAITPAGLWLDPRATRAQSRAPLPAWPDRRVRLIVPDSAGSGIDLVARVLGEGLAARLGQPFPVDNRPGAESLLAAEAHVSARPGDALLVAPAAVAAAVPLLHEGKLPYNPADLVPAASLCTTFLCLAVPAVLPVADVAGLVALARSRPGALNWYTVPGASQLFFRMFLREHGLDMSYVAYRSGSQAMLDLVADRIQVLVLSLASMLAPVSEGRIRLLAVASRQRAPLVSGVPTVAEAGFPNLTVDAVIGLFGWRGMPVLTREHLAAEAMAALREPAATERLHEGGLLPSPGGASEMAGVISAQRTRVEAALRTLGPRAQ